LKPNGIQHTLKLGNPGEQIGKNYQHFIKGGKDISEMPLDKFIGIAYCLDFTDKSPSRLIDREMLEKKLKNNNINPKEGDIVLIRAWPGKWGEKGFFSCQGLNLEAAKFLLNKKIKMIGIDLRMFDIVGDKHRPLHMLFLKNEVPLIENLVNLDKLPTHKHFVFIGLPLNLGLCTASPIRAVAILDGEIAMLDSKN